MAYLLVESPLIHPSVMAPTAWLRELGGYREFDGPEDYELWLRAARQGARFAKLPRPLLVWRDGPWRLTRASPRYAPERHREAKAPFLAARLRSLGRPLVVWGAGPTGKRLARELERHGVFAERFVDVDPATNAQHGESPTPSFARSARCAQRRSGAAC